MTNSPPPSAATLDGADDRLLAAIGSRLDEAVLVVETGTRQLRYVNPAAAALLGLGDLPAGVRLDEAVKDFRLALMLSACATDGKEVVRELADPAQGRHVVARCIPVGGQAGERPRLVVMVLRDESRLRRLETVRRDFVANVSHELRTPITAIQLLVETLQEGALEERDVAAEFVGKIGLEVVHMAQIVSELLELSATESGRRQTVMTAVPMNRLFAAAERLRPLAGERRVELHFDLPERVPTVRGDDVALAQVIRNLVHNAIKFTPEHGSITVSARAGGGEPPMVELSVTDTGCGIPREEAARIFERFYKADKSRQRDGEGTGLGLAIARHTVELHGGTIGVTSEPGEGSTFWVRLPAWTEDGTG